ncbi:MAG: hypothetical protein AAF648_10635 [Pseudomonadota bacterium]
MPWGTEAVLWGLAYSLWLSALILLSYRHQPRIWLHDYPPEMRACVPPKTDSEVRLTRLWALPVTGSMLLIPAFIALWRDAVYGFTYFEAYAFVVTIMLTFCVFDLLVLDWLITVWWRPAWMQLKGAEAMRRHDNVRYHLVRSVQGLPFPLVGGAVAALPFVLR